MKATRARRLSKRSQGRSPRKNCGKWTPTGGASNYLSVGQIYLLDNPLLKEPLKREHIKPRLLGGAGKRDTAADNV